MVKKQKNKQNQLIINSNRLRDCRYNTGYTSLQHAVYIGDTNVCFWVGSYFFFFLFIATGFLFFFCFIIFIGLLFIWIIFFFCFLSFFILTFSLFFWFLINRFTTDLALCRSFRSMAKIWPPVAAPEASAMKVRKNPKITIIQPRFVVSCLSHFIMLSVAFCCCVGRILIRDLAIPIHAARW